MLQVMPKAVTLYLLPRRGGALVFSSSRVPAVSVYPDSDRIGVSSGNEPDELMFKRAAAVTWSEGGEGWQLAS